MNEYQAHNHGLPGTNWSWRSAKGRGKAADLKASQEVPWDNHIQALVLVEELEERKLPTVFDPRRKGKRPQPKMATAQVRHQLQRKFQVPQRFAPLPGTAGEVELKLFQALELVGKATVTPSQFVAQVQVLAESHGGVMVNLEVSEGGDLEWVKYRFADGSYLTADEEGVR